MSRAAGQPKSVPTTSYKVVWFPPDRPVEGSTIYVRPTTEIESVIDVELATSDEMDS
jgi:hypothetical protein